MLGPDTIDEHPELENYPYPISLCKGIVYISPRDEKKYIASDKVIPVISRKQLNQFLLDMAIKAGAKFFEEKVLNIPQDNSKWRIDTNDSTHYVDIVVGADGANSLVRKATIGGYPEEHLALTCGYILIGIPENQYVTKFLDIEGYLWIISRSDHASAGIGAKLGTVSGKKLFNKLDAFLRDNYNRFQLETRYSALIPTATNSEFFNNPCCGDNWMLIGDAAGHVNPAVGEGIYYALGSAKLAAQAILNRDIHSYDKLWREKYGDTLREGAAFRQKLSMLPKDFAPLIGDLMFKQAIKESLDV